MLLSAKIVGCLCFASLLTTAAPAELLRGRTQSPATARDERSVAFGPKIIDIALAFSDTARQSLTEESDTAVPAQMSFTDDAGTYRTYDVKVHIKGGTGSRRSIGSKPSFKVDIAGDNRFFGLEHLTLNNMVQDATMLHEALGYQVYEAAGAKAASTGYARLTVDGQAYGLYLNLETTDAQFLKRVFGDDGGLLYEGAYGVDLRAGDAGKFELHAGEDPDRAILGSLIRAVDTPGDGLFYGPSRQVDTESFLATMAADALLGNWDSYYTSNNYRLYWNRRAGRWFLIPGGIDQAFSGTKVFGATGLLFQKCLASERCTTDYAHSVRDVAGRFERLGLPAKTAALLSVIDPAAQADPKKKYNANTMAKARDAMLAFIARRPDEMRVALSCMDDATIGACAGVVVVNAAANQCAAVPKEQPEEKPAQNGETVGVSACLGTAVQRWRVVAKGDAIALTSVSSGKCLDVQNDSRRDTPMLQLPCTGADSQLFGLLSGERGTQLVAARSGLCVAAAPGTSQSAALIQVPCADEPAQMWQMQRSIYQ